MFWILFDPASAVVGPEKILVVIVTVLYWVLGGFEPEDVVSGTALAISLVLFAARVIKGGERKSWWKDRLLLPAFGLACVAVWAKLTLKLPSVEQDPAKYGAFPVRSLDDLPDYPSMGKIFTEGEWFRDEFDRVVFLRGVNLGGDSKIPTSPNGESWNKKGFYDYKGVSFVGRPFPLDEADEHLGRLRSWGFTFLRLLITWEAIEHDGPGQYDTEYINYIHAVVKKCADHGISVFIDPHQDVWSRWTGGDGAPAWTLEKVGFNLQNLYASGATITHQEFGDPFPQMVWPTNYNRLAAATMFTLFFAGDTYAPNTKIEGIPVQKYLQDHYLAAIKRVASVLRDCPNVVGYDTLNEPSPGYVGLSDLNRAMFAAPLGTFFSGFQGMQAGAGIPVDVPVFDKPLVLSRVELINPTRRLAWKSHAHDIWRNEGVWERDNETGKARLLRSDHFALNSKGEKVDFITDFMAPFFERFQEAIHEVHPKAIIFAEPHVDPNRPSHGPAPTTVSGNRLAWAPHYYDAATLLLKLMRPWFALDVDREVPMFGKQSAAKAIRENLKHLRDTAKSLGGNGAPVLIGEVGIAMDLDRDDNGMAKAYKDGDYSAQILAADRTMRGLEANFISFTWWTYAARNKNSRGDLWNDEDLSLWSKDQQIQSPMKDINSGGRALQAAIRPYPMKTCGIPTELSFDPFDEIRTFRYSFSSADSSCSNSSKAPTVVYVPKYQYPQGVNISVSDGYVIEKLDDQHILYIHSEAETEHSISIVMK